MTLITSIAFLFVAYLCSTRFVTLANGSSDWWVADWKIERTLLDGANEIDPNDNRATMRGSGEIKFGNEISIFKDSPRLYISNGIYGWEDVEFIAYGKYMGKGSVKSYSGLTLVARSNHDTYNGCDAFGYYARIYLNSGECAFQKEYYHEYGGSTVYSPSTRTDCFAGGLPLNQWIGMKFRVTTVSGTDNVKLELFLDRQNSGVWTSAHSFIDIPGQWKSSKSVPSQCPHGNGDTVLGARNVCFLRTDGSSSTEVHWRDASIKHLSSPPQPSPTPPVSNPRPTPPIAPKPSPPSCVAGETGVVSVDVDDINVDKNNAITRIIKVKNLKVGDMIRGYDADLNPTQCRVEAVGNFGTGEVFGNYTSSHYMFNEKSKVIEEHGTRGDMAIDEKYDLISNCPLVEDEVGNKFGPIDSDFCGGHVKEMSMSDYLLLHKAILNVVRESGTYWFSGASYSDFDMVNTYAPHVCRTMVNCVKDHESCHELESASIAFIENGLSDSARKRALAAFHNIGSHRRLGSVSASVTSGGSVRKLKGNDKRERVQNKTNN
jgi:hypothetical protein